jgi:hypothetical protein
MAAEEVDKIGAFFEQYLIPFIDTRRIAVADGGTSTGVMEAIGVTRRRLEARFPLIGVVVEALVRRKPEVLQKDHSHFVLTPGSEWGDEVPWLGALAGTLAGEAPSLTILVNGGSIAWQDLALSVEANRPVLVADGSGRTADQISQTNSGISGDPRAADLLKSRLVSVANPFSHPEQFMRKLENIFDSTPNDQ